MSAVAAPLRDSTTNPLRLVGPPGEPIDIILAGNGHVAPKGLLADEVHSWCTAPIGGEPLCQRILASLLGLPIGRLMVTSSGDGGALVEAMERSPSFGLKPELVSRIDSVAIRSLGERHTLIVPGNGLTLMDTAALLRGAERTDAVLAMSLFEDGEVSRGVTLLPRGVRPDADLLADPSSAAALRLARFTGKHVEFLAPGRYFAVNTPARLRRLGQAAASDRIRGLQTWGRRRGGALVGPRARIAGNAKIHRAAAIGSWSYVGPTAVLERGSVLGERVYVAAGARLCDALVLNGAEVRPGERLRSVVRTRERDLS